MSYQTLTSLQTCFLLKLLFVFLFHTQFVHFSVCFCLLFRYSTWTILNYNYYYLMC